jgi:hypothetical protein
MLNAAAGLWHRITWCYKLKMGETALNSKFAGFDIVSDYSVRLKIVRVSSWNPYEMDIDGC